MLSLQKAFTLFITVMIWGSAATAQNSPVTIDPQKPEPGESVTITYHPNDPEAKIESPKEIFFVKHFAPGLFNQPNKIPLEKTSNGWETSFTLLDDFSYASFYFLSGNQTDKNSGDQYYELLAYRDGKPVEGAFVTKSYSLADRYENASDSVIAAKRANLYRKELEYHPDYFDAKIRLIAHQLNTADKNEEVKQLRQEAHKIIETHLAENPRSFSTLQDVQNGYTLIGEKAKGDSLEKELIEKYPNSDMAMLKLYEKADKEDRLSKKLELLERYISTDFKPSVFNKYYLKSAYKSLIKYYANLERYDEAQSTAKKWLEEVEPIFEHQINSKNYLAVAQIFLEHKVLQETAMEYAQQALQLTDEDPAKTMKTSKGRIVKHISDAEEQKFRDQRKGEILSTIGQIYVKQNQLDEAEKYFNKAKTLSDSRTTRKYLANFYLQTDEPGKAYDIYWDLLMKIPTDEYYQKKLKEAYIAHHGSEEGFEKETQELNEAWEKKMVQKLKKKRLDKKASDLNTITDLEGNPIDPNKFEDKILVIDFWATWCKPCLEMFPYMQEVYEKYKDRPEVEFLVLNSAWNNTLEKARKWRSNNEYTFPIYFDKNSTTTEAFEVRGLPTTLFIDQNGIIRFEKRGLRGNNIVKSIALRIDMLLDEK